MVKNALINTDYIVHTTCTCIQFVLYFFYQVGKKYLLENEEELKDRIDFMQQMEPTSLLGK